MSLYISSCYITVDLREIAVFATAYTLGLLRVDTCTAAADIVVVARVVADSHAPKRVNNGDPIPTNS